MNLAISYFYERQKIMDLYRYYGTSKKKHLAELNKQMPKIILMLDAIDKKKRLVEKEKEKGTVSKEFVW